MKVYILIQMKTEGSIECLVITMQQGIMQMKEEKQTMFGLGWIGKKTTLFKYSMLFLNL